MFKIYQILSIDSLKHKVKLYFWDELQNPTRLLVINSKTNSNLNLPIILKEFKPFWKNLINSLKFYLHMLYLSMNLHGLTYIQILEVSLQVGIVTWFISYPIRAGHLSILLPLSQAHHCTKLSKECSKLN
jgi:hypothetical protein